MANLTDIYKKASLVMKPAAMKEGKLYSQQPHSGAGDFTFSRANGVQTRINEHGLIESVADNTPRLSYDLDADGNVSECPTLLLEPTRTNSTTYSEDLSNTSYWNNVIGASVLTNEGVAPDGTNTANKVKADSGSNYKIIRKGAFSIPSGITMSMFVKRGNHDYIIFKAQGDYGFNLSTLEWQSNYDNVGYELYPNGWVRLYATTTSSSTSYFGIYLANSSFGQFWSSTGDEFVYAWGAQYETGGYATNYIPTEGSTEVRNAELINSSHTGLTSESGTIFINLDTKGLDSNYSKVIALRDTSTGDSIRFEPFASGSALNLGIFGLNGGNVLPLFPNEATLPVNNNTKLAFTFSGNSFKMSQDGNLVTGTYTGTPRQYNQIVGADVLGGAMHNSIIHELTIFNEVLTDSELITLTT